MTEKLKPAVELEQEARAINATDWQPLPGMMKKQCTQCRYWFALPEAEADATSRCPDCAGIGTKPVRKTLA
jgi:PHP family Zn ribbon phosphoesterase